MIYHHMTTYMIIFDNCTLDNWNRLTLDFQVVVVAILTLTYKKLSCSLCVTYCPFQKIEDNWESKFVMY